MNGERRILITIRVTNSDGDMVVYEDSTYGDEETIRELVFSLTVEGRKDFDVRFETETSTWQAPTWQAVNKLARKLGGFARFNRFMGFGGKVVGYVYIPKGLIADFCKVFAPLQTRIDGAHGWAYVDVSNSPFKHGV